MNNLVFLCLGAYNGQLYIAFGSIRSQGVNPLQLHYNDVWRFDLSKNSWFCVSVTTFPRTTISSQSSNSMSLNHIRSKHYPSARRRAVVCLYLPYPSFANDTSKSNFTKAGLYLFGGTQPVSLCKPIFKDYQKKVHCVNDFCENLTLISDFLFKRFRRRFLPSN